MSDYDFIVDNIRYSYSSTGTYDTCAYSFKLSYIDKVVEKESNFYGEYGTLIHLCFEKFFRNELEYYELSDFYKNTYDEIVKAPAPMSFLEVEEKYKKRGQEYFDSFYFDKTPFEILFVEDSINFEFEGVNFVAKPDLVLKDKYSKKSKLVDYKTSTPMWIDKRTGNLKEDKAKMAGYVKQMYLYTYALRNKKGIPVDSIEIWFPRLSQIKVFPFDIEKEQDSMVYIASIVKNIRKDNIFAYDNSNPYFCENLCNVRKYCQYWH